MVGLSELIAGLALLTAFAALWFANDVSRRVEEQTQIFLETHVARLQELITKNAKAITELGQRVGTLESGAGTAKQDKKEMAETLAALAKQVEAVHQEVVKLDKSILAKCRTTPPKPQNTDKARHI